MSVIEAGDIVAYQGTAWYSPLIRKFTGGGPYSHIAIVTATKPFIQVTEALTRVVVNPLDVSIKGAAHAWILHPPIPSDSARDRAVERALSYVGRDYGWIDLALQAADAETQSKFFTEHFAETYAPICSMLADLAEPILGMNPKSITPNDFAKLGWPTDQLK